MTLGQLLVAVTLLAPTLSGPTRRHYAETAQQAAARHQVDPLLLLAIVGHESRFRATLRYVVGDELYVGLGQVRARNYPECRADLTSATCVARIAALQDGATNLHVAAQIAASSRAYCRRHLKRRPSTAEWLSLYQGYGGRPEVGGGYCLRARSGKSVPAPKLTRRVLKMRACLARATRGHRPRSGSCYP